MGRIDSTSNKLWIVSELFYPDETGTGYILTKIANRLTQKYDVNVICGPTVYDKDKKTDEFTTKPSDKIKIIRKELSGNKNKISTR
ncbi:hypothetical protein LJB95_03550, partial [Paludibacteraceae bacterium OttesenSCG-928-F17]|nr:hypothetical protein [Paludibacteraceae bacterium OttesenSCG-928-F17]